MNKLWNIGLQSYQGLEIGCAPGTHEAAVELICRHVEHRDGVVDLGARYGALLARLRDQGFSDLNAVDLDVDCFKLDGVPIQRLNLNRNFAERFDRKFKLIVSSDVIEHLDSPRHFLKQCHTLLDDDGYILITLPNIMFWVGRVKFMLTGEHWGFGEKNYRIQRHISPMTFDVMRLTMQEIGFRLVAATSAGSFAGSLKKILTSPLAMAIRVIGGPRAFGESAIYLAQKVQPDRQLNLPKDYRSWNVASDSHV